MKKVAILQSCYIPWKGYFDIMRRVDEFVLYDDVQFTKNDWRNRNKIKTGGGGRWLTIPIPNKLSHIKTLICEVEVSNSDWAKNHWNLITQNYKIAPFWDDFKVSLEELYELASKEKMLSRINYIFLRGIAELLGIKTKISWSMDYDAQGRKTDRLLDILKKTGATHYLSGPSAKDYIEEEKFKSAGIELEWMEYNYPEYPQLYPPFEHGVSVLDLIFNVGEYIRKGDVRNGCCDNEKKVGCAETVKADISGEH